MINRILGTPQVLLILILALVFSIHAYWLDSEGYNLYAFLMPQAYVFNAAAAIGILSLMMRLAKKSKDYLGFVFMGGSLLKFLVFFLFFYPDYKEDGEITALEFSSFFIPYLISLSFKSFVLLRSLNKD